MWPYPSCRAMSVRALLSTALIGSSAIFAPGIATAKYVAAASAFVDSGTMTVVADATAVDLDPASDENYGSDNIARNIDDELVANDHASISKFFPKLAVSWSSNPDQSVWTFHLRRGVKFHTGRCCLTATDVQYSISRTIQANLSASYLFSRFISNPSKQITVVDPYTVQFSFSRGTPLLLNALAGEFTALILDSQALKPMRPRAIPGHTAGLQRTISALVPTPFRAGSMASRRCWCDSQIIGAAGAAGTSARSLSTRSRNRRRAESW